MSTTMPGHRLENRPLPLATRSRIQLRHLSIVLLAAIFAICSSCGSPPKRPAYEGADNVGAIDASIFPGTWRQTILNPVEGEETADVVISFTADGQAKVVSKAVGDDGYQIGNFEGIGTWKVVGDTVVMDMKDMKETSGNQIAGLALIVMKGMMKKTSGSANPMEMNRNMIIWSYENSDQVIRLDRIN